MILSYEKQWFGINFCTIDGLSVKHVANRCFYNNFYSKFFEKYQSYQDLPEGYLKEKKAVSKFILSRLTDNYNGIVSVGCGNGVIEYFLSRDTPLAIHAYEPSETATRLINKDRISLVHDYYVGEQSQNTYLHYASYIDYAMNNTEYLDFLKTIHSSMKTDSKFLMIGLSLYRDTFFRVCFYKYQKLKYQLSPKGVQLWGYLRTEEEHRKIAELAGFDNIRLKRHLSGFYYMELSK